MSDRRPVIIAIAVGGLALAANGAAAMIAVSASTAPPEAAAFGVTGLSAAFLGLIATMIWACRDETAPPIRHERVFTPWLEREDDEPAPLAGPRGRAAFALARSAAPAPTPALPAAPAVSDDRVVYLADWLKARGTGHA